MSVQDISQTMMKAVFPAFDGFALTSTHAATDGIDAKRVLDVAASLLLIVLLSPVLALVTIAVMLDSRGPLMFAQRRTGLTGGRGPGSGPYCPAGGCDGSGVEPQGAAQPADRQRGTNTRKRQGGAHRDCRY